MGEICCFHSKNIMFLSIVEGGKEEKEKSSLEAKAFQVDLQDLNHFALPELCAPPWQCFTGMKEFQVFLLSVG